MEKLNRIYIIYSNCRASGGFGTIKLYYKDTIQGHKLPPRQQFIQRAELGAGFSCWFCSSRFVSSAHILPC
ncbi:hypothetical protein AQUCO_09200013v1 [Aquilegia coerulea]|uniref:Uncharacterized protein n=1 Tax=Aquilegia coerulea TaxID=218851 RepID=A0A2G5C6S5_AQUCA|nr:hypothetical protein AQUCO_09200013v1 [Aquilegia coerulea]